MLLNIGDIVNDLTDGHFSGVGKLEFYDHLTDSGEVSFFSSPTHSSSRTIIVPLPCLEVAHLAKGQNIYIFDKTNEIWRRGHYGGWRPNATVAGHLVLLPSTESGEYEKHIYPSAEIFVLNLDEGEDLDPVDFLANRCVDLASVHLHRHAFIEMYNDQRIACEGMGAVSSSSIQFEGHQLAVAQRILSDNTKKYLLADEVGLGKTLEAGIVLKEGLLSSNAVNSATIAVPKPLLSQWNSELSEKFNLEDLFGKSIHIVSHESLRLKSHFPDILIIDEAHLISPWAWSSDIGDVNAYQSVARMAANAEICLLLSGTPLNGNEVNYLAMLHLLSPDSYSLTEVGIAEFKHKASMRERLGGIYRALNNRNDNGTIEENLGQLTQLFTSDKDLKQLVENALPHFDWMAISDSPERSESIRKIRLYMGENFRIYQRMLRNRRSDPGIAGLFPGLAGAQFKRFACDGPMICEQILDAFRAEFFHQETNFLALTPDNFIDWVEDALTSPMQIEFRAKTSLEKFGGDLSQQEKTVLNELISASKEEQRSKDDLLKKELIKWLQLNKNGRVIIFCGLTNVADHVKNLLDGQLVYGNVTVTIERHQTGMPIKFLADDVIRAMSFAGNVEEATPRVFVCDQGGEDGLNLHGGRKLVVHYSQPLSFSRVEQRMGRVNRYSAHLRAEPVQIFVMLPDREGYSQSWQKVLDEALGIYNESVASLQFVLEDQITRAWSLLCKNGVDSLIQLYSQLAGENGAVDREKRSLFLQEQLDRNDELVQDARQFANRITHADLYAENHYFMLTNWIIEVLKFSYVEGLREDTFRFTHRSNITLFHTQKPIEKCVIGIDRRLDDGVDVVTHEMSASRKEAVVSNKIYPMRFGQPFVDLIYGGILTDTRGMCAVIMRRHSCDLFPSVATFFCFYYLLSNEGFVVEPTTRIVHDDRPCHSTRRLWYDGSGLPLEEDDSRLRYLNQDQPGDMNIYWPSHWNAIKNYLYSPEKWSEMVLLVAGVVKEQQANSTINVSPNAKLTGIKAVMMVAKTQ